MNFDWNDLAFGSKKPLRDLRAIFIAAPREISAARFTELVKKYLPQGNIVLGLAKEDWVLGFEKQPQFKTLQQATVQGMIDKVNTSKSPYKIATLLYSQRELQYVLQKIPFKKAVFINGSWQYSFHTQAPFYTLTQRGLPYELVSPFTSDTEAQAYEAALPPAPVPPVGTFTAAEMLDHATKIAAQSFDHSFQIGVVLGRHKDRGYEFLEWSFNKVVPYQTYAMHYGATRETHFSPPHDLNHYDTVHAEVMLILAAQRAGLNLHGTTLFINLLPCPSCARMFTQTDIAEFIYEHDHSDGYGLKMLHAAGKRVKRIVR